MAGGLSQQEETFTAAMSAKTTRRRRQRRFAVAAVVSLALAVATVMSSLWKQARDEAQRAEAISIRDTICRDMFCLKACSNHQNAAHLSNFVHTI